MFDFTKNARMFVGQDTLEPGCEQWVWQVSCHIQMYAKRINTCSDDLIKEMREALPQKPWNVFPPNSPAKSPDRYFSILLDKSWGEIKQAVILVNPKHKDVLDELEKECLAVRASETPPAPVPLQPAEYGAMGGRGKKASYTNNDITGFNGDRGTFATYRLAKLKRDHPQVAARVEAGEFKNVAEAERAAGIKPPKRDTKSPAYLLTYCKERLGADSAEAALTELARAAGYAIVRTECDQPESAP